MKLNFSDIFDVSQSFSCSNTGWCAVSGGDACSVVAHYSVVRKNLETVVVEGRIEGSCVIGCDRCGEDVNVLLDTDFSYTVTTREEVVSELAEVEYDFEDVMTVYVQEPIVDIEAILHEQAELSIPLQILCHEDCKGLCTGCGVALDKEKCKCGPGECTSPFAVLKKLSQR